MYWILLYFKHKESDGIAKMAAIIHLLKQSSCYGNHEATYALSSIYNYGLSVPVDELQVGGGGLGG